MSPTLWHTTEKSPNILKQVWFAGVHASLAGAYVPHALGDISLVWMISEVSTLTDLEFDKEFLIKRLKQHVPQNPTWGAVPEPPYPLLADKLVYAFGPKLKRTPGRYPTPPGALTNEFYHHSVTERIAGTPDKYPAGAEVVNALTKLPYTKMEYQLAAESGLTTPAHVQAFWQP